MNQGLKVKVSIKTLLWHAHVSKNVTFTLELAQLMLPFIFQRLPCDWFARKIVLVVRKFSEEFKGACDFSFMISFKCFFHNFFPIFQNVYENRSTYQPNGGTLFPPVNILVRWLKTLSSNDCRHRVENFLTSRNIS